MALTQISTGGIKNATIATADIAADAIDATKIADGNVEAAALAVNSVLNSRIADDAVTQAKIADSSIDEARLQISNAGSNGQYLQKQSGNTGGLTWADVSAGVTSDAYRNTVAGTNSGDSFSGGTTDTTLFGYDTGTAITSGDYNTFIGSKTGDSTTTGAQNTIVGASAFLDNET